MAVRQAEDGDHGQCHTCGKSGSWIGFDIITNAWAAMTVGFCKGAISAFSPQRIGPSLGFVHLQDSCRVNSLHGLQGILGAVVSIITITLSTSPGFPTDCFPKAAAGGSLSYHCTVQAHGSRGPGVSESRLLRRIDRVCLYLNLFCAVSGAHPTFLAKSDHKYVVVSITPSTSSAIARQPAREYVPTSFLGDEAVVSNLATRLQAQSEMGLVWWQVAHKKVKLAAWQYESVHRPQGFWEAAYLHSSN